MRILMVLDREFPPDIRVENEISALFQAGHEIHLACYTQKHKPVYELTEKVTIYRKPIPKLIYKLSAASLIIPCYFAFWRQYLRKILKTQPFDIIHVHDLPLAKVGMQLKKQFNLKLVTDLHENWPAFISIAKHVSGLLGRLISPVYLWKRYEKNMLKHADAVIVVVDESKTRLVQLGLNDHLISVVSNTLNLDDINYKTPVVSRHGIILFYAGGINYHRGLQHVIAAMGKTANKKLIFWILGEGSYKNELEKLVIRHSLTERVIFHGYKPFGRVMEMLSESDFAMIPHVKNEHTNSTIPHKLFQYMYAQKPVIASDCIPIERIVKETGAGITYPSDQIDSLVHILDALHTYDYLKMAENGRKAVLEKYNWHMDSQVLLDLYNVITKESAS